MKKSAMLAVGVLVLAAAGWLAAARGPATSEGASAGSARTEVVRPATPGPVATGGSGEAPSSAPGLGGALPHTGDADAYAAAVAAVVFGMDTREHAPGDYRELLLSEADPNLTVTGHQDLERLLADRIPSEQQWARMRVNAQWSAFAAAQVWEPGSWTQVVIAGQAEPGWVVRNVTGVQETHYAEAGAEKSALRERTVTIAMRCPAAGANVERCRLVLVGGSVLP